MKLEIGKKENGCTSLKVDGVELGDIAVAYRLEQEAGCPPELTLLIAADADVNIDIPDGAVYIERESQNTPDAF